MKHKKSIRKFTGTWWLPSSGRQVAGELRLIRNRPFLHIHDELHERSVGSDWPSNANVIHGVLSSRRKVTIYDAFYFQMGTSLVPGGPRSCRVSGKLVIFDAHLAAPLEQRFSAMRIHLRGFEKWTNFQAILDDGFGKDAEALESRIVCRQTRPWVLANLDDITIQVVSSLEFRGAGQRRTILHRGLISIEPTTPRDLDWCLKMLVMLERLFSLLYGNSILADDVRLIPVMRTDDESAFHILNSPRLVARRKGKSSNPRFGADIVLPLGCLSESLARKMAECWLQHAQIATDSLNLYFAQLADPGSHLESRFLPLVQAFEVYWRECFPSEIEDTATFQSIRDTVVAAIPGTCSATLSRSMRDRLHYANEPSLKDKLLRLFGTLEEATVALLVKDRDQFAKAVKDTRNYLTHYSPSDNMRVLRRMDMHWATVKLKYLFQFILLKQIGMPEELLRQQITSHWRFSQEQRQVMSANERGDRLT